MAYSISNPPRLVVAGIGSGPQVWAYASSDPTATVDTAGYFSNALGLGMKVGDLVNLHDSTTKIVSSHTVLAVTSTGADLGAGTTIGSTTNGD